MTTYLPADPAFTQVDPIHRLSLLKPPITTAHGLVLCLALHNDLGTRIARDNLTVTVGWTFQDGVGPGQYVLAGGAGAATTNKWSQAGVAISQFDVSRMIVPIVQRGASVPVRGWKKGAGPMVADMAVDPLPLASLAITVAPTPLISTGQLWQPEQTLDWIMPLRIQFPTTSSSGSPDASSAILSRPIRLTRPDTSSGTPPPLLWISEPSAFDHKPLGSSVWDAALVLAGHLSSSQFLTTSTIVVELGAGCGFLGQVLAASGRNLSPRRTVLTDLPDVVEPFMRNNTRALQHVACAAYAWGDPWPANLVPDNEVGPEGQNVVIVGADITYNEALYPCLLATMLELRRKWPSAKVVVAFKRRSSDGEEAFLRQFDDQVVKGMNGGQSREWGLRVVAKTAGQVYVVEAGSV